MKKINLFVALLSFSSISIFGQDNSIVDPPKNGVAIEKYENGKTKIKATYRNGLLNGFYTEYGETGKIVKKTNYKRGKKDGLSHYYQKGKIVKTETWSKDNLIFPISKQQMMSELGKIRNAKIDADGCPADHVIAARRLMEHRFICRVPWENIKLSKEWMRRCTLGAKSNAMTGKLTHTPSKPGGMSEADYKEAYLACTRSNLFYSSSGMSFSEMVDGWMDDLGDNNKDRVGHRRWCVNPNMGATAFGIDTSRGVYAAMWCFDRSREVALESVSDFIAFPTAGYHPKTHFSLKAMWNITLNTKVFQKPDKKTKVEVRKLKYPTVRFDLDKAKKLAPHRLVHFNVDTSNIGSFANAIVFAPENPSYNSAWLVTVKGIKRVNGDDAEINYVVEFF